MRTKPIDYEAIMVNHPTSLSQRWGNFDAADRRFIAVMSFITTLTLVFYGKFAAVGMFTFMFFCLIRNPNGRMYFTFGQGFYGLVWIGWVQKNVLWEAEQSNSRFSLWVRRLSPLSLDLDILSDPENPDEEIGLIYSRTGDTDSVPIFGDGSDVASVGLETQYSRNGEMADVTRRCATTPGLAVGASYVFRRRPPDVEKVRDWDAGNNNPNVLLPEALEKDPEDWTQRDKRDMFLFEGMSEVWQMVEETTAQVTMATVLTIKRQVTLAQAVKGKGLKSGREISRLSIVKLAQTAVEGLERAHVDNPRIASPKETESFLRRSWDVATVGEYDLERSEQDPKGVDLTTTVRQWPHGSGSSIVVAKDHCIIDGTVHGVVRITGISPNPLPNWIRQVFSVEVPWLSVALVGETLGYRGEYRILERIIPIRAEIRQRLFGMDDTGPRAQEVQENLEQRRDDIYRSRVLQNYVVLIAVSGIASDMEKFEDDMAEIIRYIHTTVGLSASRVKGKVRQIPYLLSATTGVPVKL